MKKLFVLLFLSLLSTSIIAQNEAQLGFFTGGYNSSLLNANDQDWGDYLPTYKGMLGVEGGYFMTLGGKVPVGFTAQAGYWGNGQNYRGLYLDSSYYEAYTHLNYIRLGCALHISTNLRRRVVARAFAGANMGFLNNYTDRYEHYRNNGDRFILSISDNAVYYKDGYPKYGRLSEKLYTSNDMGVFYGLGFDVKITDQLIYKLMFRFDNGIGQMENENAKTITFDGENASVIDYPEYAMAIKYHGPTRPEIIRQPTTNQMYGIYMGLTWRFYDHSKYDIYYH